MEPLIVAAVLFAAAMGFNAQPEPELEPEVSQIVQTADAWKLKGMFRVKNCHEGFVLLSKADESISQTALKGVKEINAGQFGPAEDKCTAAVFSRKSGNATAFAVAVMQPVNESRLHPGADYTIQTNDDDVIISEQ